MQFREQRIGGVTVIYAEGDFVISSVPCGMQGEVKTVLARGECHIVLNLSGIKRMDSSCLGELVASYTSTIGRGGVLNLAAPTNHVRRLLELTRLDTVIKVFQTDDDAIADFASAS